MSARVHSVRLENPSQKSYQELRVLVVRNKTSRLSLQAHAHSQLGQGGGGASGTHIKGAEINYAENFTLPSHSLATHPHSCLSANERVPAKISRNNVPVTPSVFKIRNIYFFTVEYNQKTRFNQEVSITVLSRYVGSLSPRPCKNRSGSTNPIKQSSQSDYKDSQWKSTLDWLILHISGEIALWV